MRKVLEAGHRVKGLRLTFVRCQEQLTGTSGHNNCTFIFFFLYSFLSLPVYPTTFDALDMNRCLPGLMLGGRAESGTLPKACEELM